VVGALGTVLEKNLRKAGTVSVELLQKAVLLETA